MNLDAPRSGRGVTSRHEQRDYVIVADFHDFRRSAPSTPAFFTYRHVGFEVPAKSSGISFGLSDWLFRVVSNLLKVLVPLGVKLGAKCSNLVLKSIRLGTKTI